MGKTGARNRKNSLTARKKQIVLCPKGEAADEFL